MRLTRKLFSSVDNKFCLHENKKIIYNGFMLSVALKQRLGAVTEDILTPSSHGRSLKILLWGGIEGI